MSFAPPPSAKKKKKILSLSPASQNAVDELQQLQFKFINNGGHADSVVTDPNFRNMIDFAILNAKDLKGSLTHMGRRKFVTIQCSSFNDFTSHVSSLVAKAREWYIKETGSAKPFITVAHDVWDGKRKQINGLSIFFFDPETLIFYKIPVALTPPFGKTAIELCETCLAGLEPYNIRFCDLNKSVNDNCTTAVKAGRL